MWVKREVDPIMMVVMWLVMAGLSTAAFALLMLGAIAIIDSVLFS